MHYSSLKVLVCIFEVASRVANYLAINRRSDDNAIDRVVTTHSYILLRLFAHHCHLLVGAFVVTNHHGASRCIRSLLMRCATRSIMVRIIG